MLNRLKKFLWEINLFRRVKYLEKENDTLVSQLNKEIDIMHKAYRFSLGALTGENKFRTDTGQILPRDETAIILVLEEKMGEIRKNLEMLKRVMAKEPDCEERIQSVEDYMRIERIRR